MEQHCRVDGMERLYILTCIGFLFLFAIIIIIIIIIICLFVCLLLLLLLIIHHSYPVKNCFLLLEIEKLDIQEFLSISYVLRIN